jgi:hypothetical protein
LACAEKLKDIVGLDVDPSEHAVVLAIEDRRCAPGWASHFTPTSASWPNAETFFAKLTRQRLQRGVFRSVDDLKAAINRFVVENKASAKLIVWTADPRRRRRCQTRETTIRVSPSEASRRAGKVFAPH